MSSTLAPDAPQHPLARTFTPPPLAHTLHQAFAILAYGLSQTSKRQYQHTFDRWSAFCAERGWPPDDLSAAPVITFLDSQPVARTTKMARLTHLRRLAQTLHTGDVSSPAFRQQYQQLQLLRLPLDDRAGQTRERRALSPDQVFEALTYWPQTNPLGLRNRALLAVLFYAGLRRSEAAALQWADIDLEAGLLTVRHGKGNKARTIPFAGPKAVAMLEQWRVCTLSADYEYVFVAVTKAGKSIGPDAPISTETIRRVCLASGDFRPHDARRTLLTNLLTSGTPLPDAQFIAGHARGDTTMHYAVVKDAQEVKGRVRLNY
jgi:integrase